MSTQQTLESGLEPIFRIEGLTKYFLEHDSIIRRLRPDEEVKTVKAVDEVDLVVGEEETVGLVGESGCGKSTLARAALRLIEPTGGEIYYEGEDIMDYGKQELREFRSEAQMIFQNPFASLNPRYTIGETLTEPMKVHGIGTGKRDRRERAAELLQRVSLDEAHLDRHPHEFSGGQRQRISIARALAVEPQLLVADEPVSALDVSVQSQILNLLQDLKEEMGLSILFISHDLSVVRHISDRINVMYLGEIAEVGDTRTVFDDPKHPYTQALLSSIPIPDPTTEREGVNLEGDIPTPIDPPSGCRFHPRCPAVIPPETWSGSQEVWRRLVRLKRDIQSGDLDLDSFEKRTTGTKSAIVDAIYESYISSSDVTQEAATLPDDIEEEVRRGLSTLVTGDTEQGAEIFEQRFQTICETEIPPETVTDDGHLVRCHLYPE